MTENPKVSIIIPHYNMWEKLRRAVVSVEELDYNNLELIIVDDGSDQVPDQHSFPTTQLNIELLKTEHSGKPRAVNHGFDNSTGEYIVILDADDELPNGSISQRVEVLQKSSADLCLGSFETRYNGEYKSVRSVKRLKNFSCNQLIRKYLLYVLSPFHQNAMMLHRNLLDRAGKMNPHMLRGQDKDFAIRLIRKAEQMVFLDETVYIYHRYDRALKSRIYNRCIGAKYLLAVTDQYINLWCSFYLGWIVLIEAAKLIHDLFGVYKK